MGESLYAFAWVVLGLGIPLVFLIVFFKIFKKFMPFISRNKWLILVFLLIPFLFYWFQFRPFIAKRNCDYETKQTMNSLGMNLQTNGSWGVGELNARYNHFYGLCMNGHGL